MIDDLLVPTNGSVTFNATQTGVPPTTVTGRVSVNGTIIIDARTIVNTTGPYNLNVFKFSGQSPNITSDKIDVLLRDDGCLKVSNVQTITVGDLFVVRIDVTSQCTTPPAIVDEFPVVPVAVGASVGFCVLLMTIVTIVVCVYRHRKKAAADDDEPDAVRGAGVPATYSRVPVQLHDMRASDYEVGDVMAGNEYHDLVLTPK